MNRTQDLPSVETLDRMGMRAFPAFVEEERDGCVYRAAGGLNYRNSSVTVLHPGRQPIETLLPSVLAFSERHDIRPVLRILGDPEPLCRDLSGRGWAPFRRCLVMIRPAAGDRAALAPSDPAGGDDVTELLAASSSGIEPCAFPTWLDMQVRHKSLEGREADLFRRILSMLPDTAVPVVYARGGDPVGSALLYREGRWLGLMNMLVAPEARGRGIGREFLERLTESLPFGFWLQVYKGNGPAVRLYEKAGFATHYRYAYWARAPQGG